MCNKTNNNPEGNGSMTIQDAIGIMQDRRQHVKHVGNDQEFWNAIDMAITALQNKADADMLISPYANDPFALIWLAFKNLYPDKTCRCWWTPNSSDLEGENGETAYGVTDTNEETGEVTVLISATGLDVNNATEIFAHELAHVAVGVLAEGEDEHGVAWQTAFEAIFAEYTRIMSSIFGSN